MDTIYNLPFYNLGMQKGQEIRTSKKWHWPKRPLEAVVASLLDGKQQILFKEKKGGQVIYFGGWNNGIVGLIRTIHTCERFVTPKVFLWRSDLTPQNSIAGLKMTLTSNVTFRTYRFHCVRTIDPS